MIHPRRAIGVLMAGLISVGAILAADEEGPELNLLKNQDGPIVAAFKDTRLAQSLGAIAQVGSFKLTLGESFKDVTITVPEVKTTIQHLLVLLGREYGLKYSVPSEGELVVEGTRGS
ncbi:MAG TPA: hypothetical protein VE404_08135 [Verrucomicrobiae bacterium]|nr:hypothetical protein [Verrucomicrobiae bacterium]